MGDVQKYVTAIVSAAIALAVLGSLLEEKSTAWQLFRLIGGVFLVFTVVQPITKIDLDSVISFSQIYNDVGVAATAEGEQLAKDQLRQGIKSRAEAYILDKAKSYDTSVEAEVTLSEDALPVPVSVTVHGNVSPYVKNRLQCDLESELGIAKENQQWIG